VARQAWRRVRTAGEVTASFPIPRANATPLGLAAARNGDLWIAEHPTGVISRMRHDGDFRRKVRTESAPDALTLGPDGDLWYASGNEGKVGRVKIGH
jgi:streptogramin lyase